MNRRIVMAIIGFSSLVFAGPAMAFQCPKLIKQINDNAGNRFDNASYEAKMKAADAQKLHSEGKHAESEAAAKEGLGKLGLQAS
jgi:hypothetical protein